MGMYTAQIKAQNMAHWMRTNPGKSSFDYYNRPTPAKPHECGSFNNQRKDYRTECLKRGYNVW